MDIIGDHIASNGLVIEPLSRSNGADFDSEIISSITESANYIVQLPPTPDLQPQPPSLNKIRSARLERNVSNSMFTGGYNAATRALSKEKKIDSQTSHEESCCVPGCCSSSSDGRGSELVICSCGCRICEECFRKDFVSGDGMCPYCRGGPYMKNGDASELSRSLSVAKSKKGHVYELDSSEFLFEEKKWRPITRRVEISTVIITTYRFIVLFRIFALALFLLWRIRNPNEDAMWLWGMSIVCEIWFAFAWLLDQLPKLCPINRVADLDLLKEKFESPNEHNPTGKSDLPGLDVFVSTADPAKEPPLVFANTVLSILAADYPVEKLSCYVSDDTGSILTFEATAEAASFANLWVPFCRKHDIEPRNPESYFSLKRDPFKGKIKPDFVRDRRKIKREYEEFKVRVNALSDSIRRRSDAFNIEEEIRSMKKWRGTNDDLPIERSNKILKATWMSDRVHWPGTWTVPAPDHSRGDHASVVQVMLQPPSNEPLAGAEGDGSSMNLTKVDIRLPMLVYVSREKRPGYDHNKKAGAMNALVRASAIMSNGAFILNLDCDHYIYDSKALREGMCFMMDRDGDDICYVQFPQRFEGIDPSDRYANYNTVFFDVNMRALDGVQGPVYVGTGCLFRRIALYGYDPPRTKKESSTGRVAHQKKSSPETKLSDMMEDNEEAETSVFLMPKLFGNSSLFRVSIDVAAFQGLPLADHPSVMNGRSPGVLIAPRKPLHPALIAEAVDVVSCFYEDKTQWGQSVGWIYGSTTEDVVTGYRMHERGWRSVYCVTNMDAFRGTAPINLTDRLHQVLRWATGSVEIFFSRNNAILAGPNLKFLQRIAYFNIGIYPFTSVFLIVYCFIPAFSLFSNQFVVQSLDINFLVYLLAITTTIVLLVVIELKWSGITLEEWWRNEQFWLIGGTSAHFAAVLQGLLKVIAGVEVSFALTSKPAGDEDEEFSDLYLVKWTWLMIPPCTIVIMNVIAIAAGISRNVYADDPEWSKLIGGVFFSLWVLAHLYPFSRGLMGRQRRTPTIVYISAGLISICISLMWVTISPPSKSNRIGGAILIR